MSKIKAKTAAIAVILLGILGVADAAVLTYDHQQASLGGETVCEPGGGCAALRNSPMAAVPMGRYKPKLPIAVLGLSCYLVVVGLGVARLRKPDDPHLARLLLGIGLLSTLYSVILFSYSLIYAGSVCPYCVGLYVVGIGLLLVSLMSLGESLGAWFTGVWKSVISASGMGAIVGFAALTFGGYSVYASPIKDKLESAMGKLDADARKLPDEPEVALNVDGRPFDGPEDAPIHIVEFADYECPHCGELYRQLHEQLKKHEGKIRITMMNFPLDNACNPKLKTPFHRNACRMAYAGECTHQQGKWAQMAAWLYANGRRADTEQIKAEAARHGIDGAKLEACMKAPEIDAQIKKDIQSGVEAGVRATPTFFVNGRMVEGGRPPQIMDSIIKAFLERGAEAK